MSRLQNVIRYVVLALAVAIPFWIISPDSVGGWVLWFAVAFVAAGLVQGAYMRLRRS